MKLSGEQFQQIISQLTSDAAGRRGQERRQQPRVGLRAAVDIILPAVEGTTKRETVRVTLRDISEGGMSFMFARKLAREQKIVLHLAKDDGGMLLVQYEIRRCIQATPGLFLVGGALTEVKDIPARKVG